jgi:hypothetical protein
MAEGPPNRIIDFPTGRWHLSNRSSETARALAIARKGVTYATHIKRPGEIIQQADRSNGTAIGDILLVAGIRFDEKSYDDPLPRYIKAVILQIEPGKLAYDPTQRVEFLDTQAIRRYGSLNEKLIGNFLQSYWEVDERIRRLQNHGYSTEEIQKIITTPQPPIEPTPPSALKLLLDALIAAGKGRIF